MIYIKNLKWSNWFCYGEGNYISIDSPITQIVGPNGVGKTSIAIVLMELYTNSNIFGFKKSELFNRHKSDTISAESEFSVNSKDYLLKMTRSPSKSQLNLFCEGNDISGHTASNTYKILEEILGVDLKTFSKLIYLSPDVSVEFLTGTDANRKRFLMQLFGQQHYEIILEKVKQTEKEERESLHHLEGKLEQTKSYLQEIPIDLEYKPKKEQVHDVSALEKQLEEIKQKISTLESINSNVEKVQQLKQERSKKAEELQDIEIPQVESLEVGEAKDTSEETTKLSDIKAEINQKEKELDKLRKNYNSLQEPATTCYACGQEVPYEEALKQYKEETERLENQIEAVEKELGSLNENKIQVKEDLNAKREENKQIEEAQKQYEKQLADKNNKVARKEKLESEIENINQRLTDFGGESEKQNTQPLYYEVKRIQDALKEAREIDKENARIEEYNNSIQYKLRQRNQLRKDRKNYTEEVGEKKNTIKDLSILKEAFSPKGIVGYKLEKSVYSLEKLINHYLKKFSNGRFILKLRMKGDKLPVTILDQGIEASYHTLSKGQKSWVNISTILAIKNILDKLSGTQVNFLFIDEISGAFDAHSREQFVEILSEEEHLNTFMVAHEYAHPTVPQVTIKNEEGVSYIEHG